MKHFLPVTFLTFCLISSSFSQNVRTSVSNGLATNPLVWDCFCLPLPGDSIIINHQITLNNDFAYLTGAVVINGNGALLGDSPNRIFGAADVFINHGKFQVSRVAFNGGVAVNTGEFYCDSLYMGTVAPGNFTNSNFLGVNTSFLNSGHFNNNGVMLVGHNFLNGDTLGQGIVAEFICNGHLRVYIDMLNGDSIAGNGQICVEGNSLNSGIIAGNLDFCDLTGGTVDLNLGTIESSVQICANTCETSTENHTAENISLYPNPSSETSRLQFKTAAKREITLIDISGKRILDLTEYGTSVMLNTDGLSSGVYFIRIRENSSNQYLKWVVE